MARERLCKVCGDWHDMSQPWPAECIREDRVAYSGLPTPMVNFDTMDPVKSMTNGMFYDSKAALRSEYKRAGVVEVGNEDTSKAAPKIDKTAQKKARKEAIGKAFSRAGLGAV